MSYPSPCRMCSFQDRRWAVRVMQAGFQGVVRGRSHGAIPAVTPKIYAAIRTQFLTGFDRLARCRGKETRLCIGSTNVASRGYLTWLAHAQHTDGVLGFASSSTIRWRPPFPT